MISVMSDDTTQPGREVRLKQRNSIGILAIGFAGTNVVAEFLATILPRMGPRWEDLATAFSWFVFDFGFLIMLAALALALSAVVRGGRGRTLGIAALVLVVASIAFLFIP